MQPRISESYSAEKKTNYFEFDDTSFLHTEYRIVCKEMAFLRLLQINSSALQLPRDEKESLYRDLNNRYGNEIVLKTHVIMEELKRFNDRRQEEMEIVKELPSDLCPNAVQNAQKVSDTFRCFFNQFWNHILSLLARLKNRLKLKALMDISEEIDDRAVDFTNWMQMYASCLVQQRDFPDENSQLVKMIVLALRLRHLKERAKKALYTPENQLDVSDMCLLLQTFQRCDGLFFMVQEYHRDGKFQKWSTMERERTLASFKTESAMIFARIETLIPVLKRKWLESVSNGSYGFNEFRVKALAADLWWIRAQCLIEGDSRDQNSEERVREDMLLRCYVEKIEEEQFSGSRGGKRRN